MSYNEKLNIFDTAALSHLSDKEHQLLMNSHLSNICSFIFFKNCMINVCLNRDIVQRPLIHASKIGECLFKSLLFTLHHIHLHITWDFSTKRYRHVKYYKKDIDGIKYKYKDICYSTVALQLSVTQVLNMLKFDPFFLEFKAPIDIPYMYTEHHSVSNIQVKFHHIITSTNDIIIV